MSSTLETASAPTKAQDGNLSFLYDETIKPLPIAARAPTDPQIALIRKLGGDSKGLSFNEASALIAELLKEAAKKKYKTALATLPASGGGGAHAALLGVANLGVLAGIDPSDTFRDLRLAVHGSRPISDGEIMDAIKKAGLKNSDGVIPPRFAPAVDGEAMRAKIIESGAGATEEDLQAASGIKIDWPPAEDSWRALSYLYQPDEYLFIGDDGLSGRLGGTIRPASKWIEYFHQQGAPRSPKIIPNPLTGQWGLTKGNKPSLRADDCIAKFRFVVCEFDTIPLVEQLAFWSAVKLPIAAIIHSGGKSLHAWVRVDCKNRHEWAEEIEQKLFPRFLIPMGLDRTCKNEARLSRMPGHVRTDTGKPQRLLYLAPEGRPVHA